MEEYEGEVTDGDTVGTLENTETKSGNLMAANWFTRSHVHSTKCTARDTRYTPTSLLMLTPQQLSGVPASVLQRKKSYLRPNKHYSTPLYIS